MFTKIKSVTCFQPIMFDNVSRNTFNDDYFELRFVTEFIIEAKSKTTKNIKFITLFNVCALTADYQELVSNSCNNTIPLANVNTKAKGKAKADKDLEPVQTC